jgi:aminoglycoside 6'-N-acetyltransferase
MKPSGRRAERPMAPPMLTGDRVQLRPLRPEDRAVLRAILAQPAVARWWDVADPDQAVDEWLIEGGDSVGFAIELDGRVIGSIQFAEENDPGYRHAGIDLFLDSEHHGRGLGPDAIRTLARYLIEVRGHHRLTIDPAAENENAIAAYRRVGFRPVGIMRRYWRDTDGRWRDGLLMDLLGSELKD